MADHWNNPCLVLVRDPNCWSKCMLVKMANSSKVTVRNHSKDLWRLIRETALLRPVSCWLRELSVTSHKFIYVII